VTTEEDVTEQVATFEQENITIAQNPKAEAMLRQLQQQAAVIDPLHTKMSARML